MDQLDQQLIALLRQDARLSVADDGGSETIFTFERKGPFEWKLVHIGLPDGVAPVPAPVTAPPVPMVGKSGARGG